MVYKLYPSKPVFEKTNTVAKRKPFLGSAQRTTDTGCYRRETQSSPGLGPGVNPAAAASQKGVLWRGAVDAGNSRVPVSPHAPPPPPPTSGPSSSLSHFPHEQGGGERKRRTTEGCSPGKGLEVRRAAGTKNNEPPQA